MLSLTPMITGPALSPTCPRYWWVNGGQGGHLCLTHAAIRQIRNGVISLMLTTSGMAHSHLHGQGSLYCADWWGTEPALLSVAPSGGQEWLSYLLLWPKGQSLIYLRRWWVGGRWEDHFPSMLSQDKWGTGNITPMLTTLRKPNNQTNKMTF